MFADSKIVTAYLNEAREYLAQETGYGVQESARVMDELEAAYGLYAKDRERVFKMREKITEASWCCYESDYEN